MQLGQLATRLEGEQNLQLHFIDGPIEKESTGDLIGIFPPPHLCWVISTPDGKTVDQDSAKQSFDYIRDIITEDGPFDGIIGHSEGAGVALELLLRHAMDHPLDPPFAICKWAIFFSRVGIDRESIGLDKYPPLGIPSLHVFDQSDTLLGTFGGSNVASEPGLAKTILHTRGHDIPRDSAMTNTIMAAIRDLQHRAALLR